jgi:hypothetical protein
VFGIICFVAGALQVLGLIGVSQVSSFGSLHTSNISIAGSGKIHSLSTIP